MAFPTTPLDLRTELQIGGTLTDITSDVYTRSPIAIEYGRSEESVRTNPSKCGLQINNRSGKYSPRNPMSPYYGLIGRNTPIRVSVAGGEPYLQVPEGVAGRATTPDHVSLDITGDIDIRVDIEPDVWQGSAIGYELIGKYANGGDQRSWRLMVTGEGQLMFTWSPTGTGTILEHRSPVIPLLRQRQTVRATLDVNNGLGGYTLTYYVGEGLAGPWTQVGQTVTTTAPTTIFASTATLEIGDVAAVGFTNTERHIYGAEVRSGIGGTVVASPRFDQQAAGTTSFADSAGRSWTVANGASISDRYVVFSGEVSSWPARWDVSGQDVWVPIEAAGTLRRLGQGRKALASTLRRRLPAYNPLAYWPCEEDDGATQAYSPLDRGRPLRVRGWRFGQDDTLAGSSPLPAVDALGTMRGTVPAPPAGTTQWSVHMLYAVDSAPASDAEFLSWTTSGTVRRWRILQRTGVGTIQGFAADGTQIVNGSVELGSDVFTDWQRVQFRVLQNGGNIDWRIDWYNIGGSAGGFGDSVAGAPGQVTEIDTQFGASVTGLRVGHIAIYPVGTPQAAVPYADADHGYNGETATARMRRLASEESATVTLAILDGDTTRSSEALGPQRPDTLLDLLQEAADCDGGILYEDRGRSQLIYRDRFTLYNQAPAFVLDYNAAGELGPPLEPIEDDQKTRNDITITRTGGSSARAVREEGPLSVADVGLYDEAATLALYQDEQAPNIAGWRLHLSTWDEARYPTVRLMLHAAPHLIPAYLRLRVGDRIQIINPPPWLPPGPIDLIVQGWSDIPDQFTWDVALNCTPAGPWTVGVLDDPVLGRIATDGCTLGGAVTSTATSMTLVSSPGPRWIDSAAYPARFPFDVLVGGERIRVNSITGTTLTQTANVTRAINGISKSHTAGASVQVADPARLAL